MPKIPTYDQRTTTPDPSRAPLPHLRGVQIVGTDFSEVARGLSDASQVLEHSQEEQAKAWAAEAVSKSRLDWSTELINRQEKAEPGAPEFTPKFVSDFDKYVESVTQGAPSPKAKLFVQGRLKELRDMLGERALEFEAKSRIDYRVDKYTSGIENTKKLMNTDPSQYPSALAEQLAIIDASALPPIQKSAMRQRAVDEVSLAAVWSQVQKSPSAFLDSIGFGPGSRKSSGDLKGVTGNAAFDSLPFERRGQMFEQAIRLKSQIDSDADRAIEKERKRIAEDTSKNLWGLSADGKLKRNHVEQFRAILPLDEYKALLKTFDRGSEVVKSDPGVYREIERLIANDDFEGAVAMSFKAHASRSLSNEHMSSFVNRARSQARQEGPKSVYERTRNYITQSLDPGPLVQDPLGRARLAEAHADFDRWFTATKRTDEEVDKRGKELVGQYRFVNLSETLMALPMPRSGSIQRNADPASRAARLEEIRRAGEEAQRRLDRREYTRQEYDQEQALINRWRKAIMGN